MPLPSPNQLKRKILIKNKRLKPEVEKQELELFRQGQFVITEDEEKEDASAPAAPLPEDKKVRHLFRHLKPSSATELAHINHENAFSEKEIEAGTDSRTLSFEEKLFQVYEYKGGTNHIHPWLSSMVNYAEPVKFPGFDVSEGNKLQV